ncbi:hypothetical protein EJ05DRAFT_512632 [Pseudovirgaria hyperparasitica]|uniref:Wax synthase domain-containing protein n=1 Tax=Pseudovirgaria hyperparasitica TaxID=470096 RepID=A0A6A6W1Q1_9PEZI|nr:uncharacterized protein EJ05DRAFT_512632 [Pseudovirgaria hyperparasitica]KAF2756069.1 hypothetical protein EJ05DRAFT_512632 [Pseudovirgaria hyperparasitica]
MTPRFSTHRELQAYYEHQFDVDVAEGKYAPFTLLLTLLPVLLAYAYFLLPHLLSYLVYVNIHYRNKKVATAFAVGLVSTWTLLWFGVMMLVYDPQTEFKRVEWGGRRRPAKETMVDRSKNGRRRASSYQNLHDAIVHETTQPYKDSYCPDTGMYYYKWQHYPEESFSKRLLWVTDLLANFRAIAWNFHVPGPPPPPQAVQDELQYYTKEQQTKIGDSKLGADGTQGYSTRKELLQKNLRLLLLGYMKLDFLKVVLMKDPYFWGYTDAAPPSYYPTIVAETPFIVKSSRLIFTMVGVWVAIETIFSLSPLFFSGLLGPKWIGAHAEPWVYPDTWGSFSNIYDRGLFGFWGSFWHQTFRFAFEAPSKPIIRVFGVDKKSTSALLIRLFTAFCLSGLMHGMGSYTSAGNTIVGNTSPLTGSFLYFLLQPLGLMLERFGISLVRKTGLSQRTPKRAAQVFRFIWVYTWLHSTSSLLADDFARAGIWLFEPCPISPLRGLGLGVEGDGLFTWGPPSEWLYYYNSGKWWSSGYHL